MMATVKTNPLINGFSGKLGQNIVFKILRGKTIVTIYPKRPTKQSEHQKTNRSKFKDAADWAKNELKDPSRKEHYKQQAKRLSLPNAYTTAIKDNMQNIN